MDKISENARIVCQEVLGLKSGETFLIVTNEGHDVFEISLKLAEVAREFGAKPLSIQGVVPKENVFSEGLVITQPVKTAALFTEEYAVEAMKLAPQILISLSAKGLGSDKFGLEKGYWVGRKRFEDLLDYLLATKKTRSFWSPTITKDIWERCIGIDYQKVRKEAEKLAAILNQAKGARVVTKKGTDFYIGLEGRKAHESNGEFSRPGRGGNLPAGEVYISPQIASCRGRLVLDGAIRYCLDSEVVIFSGEPLVVHFENGYLKEVEPGKHKDRFLANLRLAELDPFRRACEEIGGLSHQKQISLKKLGKIIKKWQEYSKNSRHCGELGIGLLAEASFVSGNGLEIEKMRKTCHIAFGMNYDNDAPALNHDDAVILDPTIRVSLPEGELTILEEGEFIV